MSFPKEPLILASGSPRRRELLTELGVPFEVYPADVDESVLPGENPRDYVVRVACLKSGTLARRFPHRLVLGADTTVVLDGRIIGKPVDPEDAVAILRSLSGRSHEVWSGICLRGPEVHVEDAVLSHVWFRSLEDGEIREYVDSGEPLDRAGAYAIQAGGGNFVARVEGSLTNVIGLPTERLMERLGEVGGVKGGGL